MKLTDKFLDMKNWAVAGVSTDKEKFAYKIYDILLKNNYKVYPINPKYDDIDGNKVYPSLKDVGEKIDVLDLVVPPKISKIYLKEAKELGIKNIWFQPGSFDEDTIKLAEELGFDFVDDDCVLAILKKCEG